MGKAWLRRKDRVPHRELHFLAHGYSHSFASCTLSTKFTLTSTLTDKISNSAFWERLPLSCRHSFHCHSRQDISRRVTVSTSAQLKSGPLRESAVPESQASLFSWASLWILSDFRFSQCSRRQNARLSPGRGFGDSVWPTTPKLSCLSLLRVARRVSGRISVTVRSPQFHAVLSQFASRQQTATVKDFGDSGQPAVYK